MDTQWMNTFMQGIYQLGAMSQKQHAMPGKMQDMMAAALPTSAPAPAASPVRKKKKKRAAPSSSSSSSPTRGGGSPAKKKKLTKKQKAAARQANKKAKAEAKAQAKLERAVSAWNMLGMMCTLMGHHEMIPDEIVQANTAAKAAQGKRFNDALSRTTLLKKILSALFKEHNETVRALHARACNEGDGVDGDANQISKQDCDRIVTAEWVQQACTADEAYRNLFNNVEHACKTVELVVDDDESADGGEQEEEQDEEQEEQEDDDDDDNSSDDADSE